MNWTLSKHENVTKLMHLNARLTFDRSLSKSQVFILEFLLFSGEEIHVHIKLHILNYDLPS